MKAKRFLSASTMAVIALLLVFNTVFAGGGTDTTVAVSYPEFSLRDPALQSCAPWNLNKAKQIFVKVPAGSNVEVKFALASPKTGAPTMTGPVFFEDVQVRPLSVLVPYPTDVTQWPAYDEQTNTYSIAVAAFVVVTLPDGTIVKKNTKQWWVQCTPDVVN